MAHSEPLHPLSRRLMAVTGETLVRDVLSATGYSDPMPHRIAFGKQIPAQALVDLKLAEVALLRRMTARLEQKRGGPHSAYYDGLSANLSSSQCEGILTAGGIASPRQPIVRLEGRNFIKSVNNGEIAVIEDPSGAHTGGVRAAHDFAECLLRDPLLVAAYRKVALAIDKVIQVEVIGSLVRDEVSYEGWMASIALSGVEQRDDLPN